MVVRIWLGVCRCCNRLCYHGIYSYFDGRVKEFLNMYFESNASILGGEVEHIKGWCKKGLASKMGGS